MCMKIPAETVEVDEEQNAENSRGGNEMDGKQEMPVTDSGNVPNEHHEETPRDSCRNTIGDSYLEIPSNAIDKTAERCYDSKNV